MIVIIDYGAGNTKSVMNTLDRIGANFELTNNFNKILSADKVIFPGVGHANHAMKTLEQLNLIDVIKEIRNPVLGICIGMQLLFDSSEEGDTQCLGIISGKVTKFDNSKVIVPQMGWNISVLSDNALFNGLEESSYFYGVHSYKIAINEYTIAKSIYNTEYSSAVQYNNFYGVQFHPEKSSKQGQLLLKNFLEL